MFVGLSVDADKAKWEARVRSGALSGTQLYIGKGTKFQSDYRISGILSRNVKISAYVPSQFGAADMDMDGSLVTNPFAIEKSFADNALTIKTSGEMLSGAQGLAANTVVVKYKNK